MFVYMGETVKKDGKTVLRKGDVFDIVDSDPEYKDDVITVIGEKMALSILKENFEKYFTEDKE